MMFSHHHFHPTMWWLST